MKTNTEIVSFRYNEAPETNKNHIKSLIRTIWHTDEDVHLKEYDAISVCAYLHKLIVGYAGVISWNITVKDNTYKMASLSCVCTHPQYRRIGIGIKIIQEATNLIINDNVADIGLFTCSPQNISLYERSGIWKHDDSLILKESLREDAFKSNLMGLAVIKGLFSEKAKSNADHFTGTTIVLNLPERQFI